MMDTDEIMRKTRRMCDLVNALVEERDYAFDMLMKEQKAFMQDEKIIAKYQGQVDLLNHLICEYVL